MVTQSSTREELRKAVGQAIGVLVQALTANSGTTTTMLVDELSISGADDQNGKWLIFTSGQSNIDGEEVQILDSATTAGVTTLTFHPAASNAVTVGATAEMWDQSYRPQTIHNAINQAVDDATGYFFTPTTDITNHIGGKKLINLANTFDMISKVELRAGMVSKIVLIAGQAWAESIAASFVVTQDDIDRIFGKMATKFVFTPGSNGDFASMDIPSADLSNMTHIEFGIKSDVTLTAASDLVLRLSASINGADTDKIIAIPLLTAGVETWVRVAMRDSFLPSAATAIISVALEYNANNTANTIWMTGIDANQEDSYEWETVEKRLWNVDKANQTLILEETLGYFLLKLTGGDNPLRLTSDTDVSELPERYIVHYAVATLLERYNSGESAEQASIRARAAARQFAMSEDARNAFPMLVDVRETN